MAERTSDFARRLGNELKTFAGTKGKELVERVQERGSRFISETERQSYNVALNIVAKYNSLTTREAEERLTARPRTKRVPVTSENNESEPSRTRRGSK